MSPPFLFSETCSSVRREKFGEASQAGAAGLFVLNAINACHGTRCIAQQSVQANGRSIRLVLNDDLDAVGKLGQRNGYFCEGDVELREGFFAGKKNCSLQFRSCLHREPAGLTEITCSTGRSRGKPGIGVEPDFNAFGVSGHENRRAQRRKLPGNPGSSRGRRRKDGLLAGPCRCCSIFRKCRRLLPYRTARRRRAHAP